MSGGVNILLGPHEDYNAQPHSKVYVKALITVLVCVYARIRLHVILDPMLRTYARNIAAQDPAMLRS